MSVFIPIPKKGNAKECSNYCTIALISQTSKVMLKILQARLQEYVNQELQMYELDLEKAEEPEIKLPTSIGSQKKTKLPNVQEGFKTCRETRDQTANIHWIIEKAREFKKKKTSISALLTMPKPLTVWITINWEKF